MRRSPTSPLLRGPPTPSSASASATVLPCTLAYPEAEASSARSRPRAASAGRACLRGHAARRGVVTGSPLLRSLLADRRGPPRFLGRPLHACRGRTPRPARRASPTRSRQCCPGQSRGPWRQESEHFRGCIPAAVVLAHLRIAASLTSGGARLATGLLAGLWPGGFR